MKSNLVRVAHVPGQKYFEIYSLDSLHKDRLLATAEQVQIELISESPYSGEFLAGWGIDMVDPDCAHFLRMWRAFMRAGITRSRRFTLGSRELAELRAPVGNFSHRPMAWFRGSSVLITNL